MSKVGGLRFRGFRLFPLGKNKKKITQSTSSAEIKSESQKNKFNKIKKSLVENGIAKISSTSIKKAKETQSKRQKDKTITEAMGFVEGGTRKSEKLLIFQEERVIRSSEKSQGVKTVDYILGDKDDSEEKLRQKNHIDDGVFDALSSNFLRILSDEKYATKEVKLVYTQNIANGSQEISPDLGKPVVRGAIKIDYDIQNTFLGIEDLGSEFLYEYGTRSHLRPEFLEKKEFLEKYARLCGVLYVLGEFDDNPQNYRINENDLPVKIDMGNHFDLDHHPWFKELKLADYTESRERIFRVYGCHQAKIMLGKYIAKDPRFDGEKDLFNVAMQFDFQDSGSGVSEERIEEFLERIHQNQKNNIDEKLLKRIKKNIEAGDHEARDLFIEFMSGIQDAIDLAESKDLNDLCDIYKRNLEKQNFVDKEKLLQKVVKFREFTLENAKEAKEQFAEFLQYYNEIKTQAPPQTQTKRLDKITIAREKKRHNIRQSDIDKFEKNSEDGIIISKDFLLANYQQYLVDKSRGKSIVKIEESAKGQRNKHYYSLSSEKEDEAKEEGFKNIAIYKAAKGIDFADVYQVLPKTSDDKFLTIEMFFGDRINYGGDVLIKNGHKGKFEKKTDSSATLKTLSYLHQKKDGHFFDLELGDHYLRNPKTKKIESGRPILIQGLKEGAAHLDVALPKVDGIHGHEKFTSLDVAKYIFLTAFNGFELCKKSNPKRNIKIKSGLDDYEQSRIEPFTLLAMQVLAAKQAKVELILSNGENEAEQKIVDWFKKRILQKIEEIYEQTDSPEVKVGKAYELCQKYLISNIDAFTTQINKEKEDIERKKIYYKYKETKDGTREIAAEIMKPNHDVKKAKSVKLVSINNADLSTAAIKQSIDLLIAKTISDKSAEGIIDVGKKINILLDAMAEYGRQTILGLDGKTIKSIIHGGKEAGFSRWKNDPEFLLMLDDYCKNQGVEGMDFSSPHSSGVKEMAKLSALIQINSKGFFGEIEGKHYKINGDNVTDIARSWRIAMIKDIASSQYTYKNQSKISSV